MDWQTKILTLDNLNSVLAYEMELVKQLSGDPFENEMHSWSAVWRKEALEHFLPLGWSFAAWSKEDSPKLLGYFIGQPFLFFRGMTQSLWIEHLNANNDEIKQHLVDVAYKTAKGNHFQKVLFYQPNNYQSHVEQLKSSIVNDNIIEVKTAKF